MMIMTPLVVTGLLSLLISPSLVLMLFSIMAILLNMVHSGQMETIPEFVGEWSWMPLTLMLVSLSLILSPISAIAQNYSPKYASKKSLFWFNVLCLMIIAAFSSKSIMWFYVFFEASLIPMLIIIMHQGYQPERWPASVALVMYTVTASLPLLIMFLSYMIKGGVMSVFSFKSLFSNNLSMLSIMGLLGSAGFLVKAPMFLVHQWLPQAHVEAPVGGSMILASLLLKLGGFGLLRFFMLWPSETLSSVLMSLALAGGVVASILCLRIMDSKMLIAYSSVGHMSMMIACGMLSSPMMMKACILIMMAHGFSSAVLFLTVTLKYNVVSTRNLKISKGLLITQPLLALLWFISCMGMMGAPPTSNLYSEIWAFVAILLYFPDLLAVVMVLAIIGVAYTLVVYTYSTHSSSHSFTAHAPLPPLEISVMLFFGMLILTGWSIFD